MELGMGGDGFADRRWFSKDFLSFCTAPGCEMSTSLVCERSIRSERIAAMKMEGIKLFEEKVGEHSRIVSFEGHRKPSYRELLMNLRPVAMLIEKYQQL